MSNGIDIQVSGVSETIRALNSYSTQLADRVVITALRAGAARFKSLLQAAAPVNKKPSTFFPAGRLKRSIIFRVSKIHKRQIDGIIGMYVRPIEKGSKGSSGSGGRYGNAKNAYYAKFVENGYEVKTKSPIGRRRIGSTGLRSGRKSAPSGKFVPKNDFINRTYRSNKSAINDIIVRSIESGANELAQRLGL